MFKKQLLAASIAAALTLMAGSASAGLTVLEKTPEKAPIPPQVVVEEGTRLRAENESLRREIDRLKAEIDRLKGELSKANTDLTAANEKSCADKQGAVVKTMDQLEQRMAEIGKAILRVNFGFNSAKFEPSQEVGKKLVAAGKSAKRVNISGHADNIGPAEANRVMAMNRALAAKQYLTGRGVPKDKVFVSRDVDDKSADNSTEEARAQNRRVDIEFVR